MSYGYDESPFAPLRTTTSGTTEPTSAMKDADITRLKAEVERLTAALADAREVATKNEDEADALRDAIEDARSALGHHPDAEIDLAAEIARIRDESRAHFHDVTELTRKLAVEREACDEFMPHAERALRALRSMNSTEALDFTNAIADLKNARRAALAVNHAAPFAAVVKAAAARPWWIGGYEDDDGHEIARCVGCHAPSNAPGEAAEHKPFCSLIALDAALDAAEKAAKDGGAS